MSEPAEFSADWKDHIQPGKGADMSSVRRLFDSSIVGLFTWNLDGRILEANEAFLLISGYGSDDLIRGNIRWKDLMPIDSRAGDDQPPEGFWQRGAARPFETELARKDGARAPVLIGAALFDGRPTEGGAFVVDLSDRRRTEAAARESESRRQKARAELAHANRIATVGQLSASIAHEVNQPLSGIVTNAGTCLRMLTAEPPNVGGARETAHRTIRDANRAAEAISRLRALFAKTEAAGEPVNLNQLAREVIEMSSTELQRERVVLRTEFFDGLPMVVGNRLQLQQVILSLLVNASEAMSGIEGRPREMVIRTEPDSGQGVRVTVRDAGTGFDPQSVDRLFEAFYTTKPSGMGVGLSISRTIVENHHGRLWATPNQGPGATFSFSVPAAPETPARR